MIKWLIKRYGYEEALRRDSMRRLIWELDEFSPTLMQEAYLMDNVRFKMVAGGVRAGKSQSPTRACDWFTFVPDGLIWIIGPDYNQARNEFKYLMAPYLKGGFVEKNTISMPQEGSWRFKITDGAAVETKSADILTKIAGEAPDMMLVTEVGQHHEGIVEKAHERSIEKYAPVIFSGTFENAYTWYSDTWMEWQDGLPIYPGSEEVGYKSYSLPTWSNTFIFPDGQDDPRFLEMKSNIPDDIYMERIEAVPFKPSGLVFRDDFDKESHVVPLEFDPKKPVELAIDPAHHTYAILFVQWHDDTVYILDEIYRHEAITQEMIALTKDHWLFEYVTGGVIDVAARQRHANYSVIELWSRHAGINLRATHTKIQQGIDAMKLRLRKGANGKPRMLFSDKLSDRRDNKGRSNGILSELVMYTWGNEGWSKHKARKIPIDAHNDAIKAISYWCVDRWGDDQVRQEVMGIETRMAYPWAQRI